MLSVTSVLAVLALAVLPARATTYTDATNDNYGTAEVDIGSVVVTNDTNNLIFTINLNTTAISQWPKYLIGIQVGGGVGGQTLINTTYGTGTTAAGNPWGNDVGISTGENYFIGVYMNAGGGGGASLYEYSSTTGWSQIDTGSFFVGGTGTNSVGFTLPLSDLGLSAGDSFSFDVWSSYSGAQGAYDALDSSVKAPVAPYTPTNYDSATAAGSTLASYTVAAVSGSQSEPQVWITFQVNMAAAIILGNFSPPLVGGIDDVEAQGSFNGWSTIQPMGVLLTNVPGTSNYAGTFTATNLTPGSTLQYKYVIDGQYGGGTWEGNVGPIGPDYDRSFTLSSTNMVLPLDYWDNITNAIATNTVTFQVDMIVETALGNFNSSHSIWVNGDWNWNAGYGLQLVQTADPYTYTGTVAFAYPPGTPVNYKYDIDGGIPANSWETNGVGPGGANNRQFVLQDGATNLPVDYFNNLNNLGPVYISRSGAQTILSWPYGTNVGSVGDNTIRLQSSTSLLGGWSDVVPNTEGQSSVTNNPSTGTIFFRLIGP